MTLWLVMCVSVVLYGVFNTWTQRPLVSLLTAIGLPYTALILGLLTPQSLGLVGLSHFSVLPFTYAIFLLLLELVRASQPMLISALLGAGLLYAVMQHLASHGVETGLPCSWIAIASDALHWTLYRAIFWTVTGDLYLATVLAVGLVLLTWGLGPIIQRRYATPGSNDDTVLLRAIVLVATATIFFYQPNLWLLIPVHGLFVWIMHHVITRHALHATSTNVSA